MRNLDKILLAIIFFSFCFNKSVIAGNIKSPQKLKNNNGTINSGKVLTTSQAPSKTEQNIQPAAQAPVLTINGVTAMNSSFSHQAIRDNGKGGPQPHFTIGSSSIYFNVKGKTAKGWGYGYRVVFDSFPNSNPAVSQNFMTFENSDVGTIQFGCVTGPSDTMILDGARLIGGSGGIDGSYSSSFNVSEGLVNGVNIGIDPRKCMKLVYYTPRFDGLQFAFGYAPNTSIAGREDMNNSAANSKNIGYMGTIYPDKDKAAYGIKNFTAGVNYKRDFGVYDIQLAAVWITEKSKGYNNIKMQHGNAYNLTAAIGMYQWKIACGYLNNGTSRIPSMNYADKSSMPNTNAYLGNAGKAWNVGVSKVLGAYEVATAFHQTTRNTGLGGASSNIAVATVNFVPASGLLLFAEIVYAKTNCSATLANERQKIYDGQSKNRRAIGRNIGKVAIIGTSIRF